MNAALLPLPQATGRLPRASAGAEGGDFAATLRQASQMPEEEGAVVCAAGDPAPGSEEVVAGIIPGEAAVRASARPAPSPIAGRAASAMPAAGLPPDALSGPVGATGTGHPPPPGEAPSPELPLDADSLTSEALAEVEAGEMSADALVPLPAQVPLPSGVATDGPAAIGQNPGASPAPGTPEANPLSPAAAPAGTLAVRPEPLLPPSPRAEATEKTAEEPAAPPILGPPGLAPEAGPPPASGAIPAPVLNGVVPGSAAPQPVPATSTVLVPGDSAAPPAAGPLPRDAAAAAATATPRPASGRSATPSADPLPEAQGDSGLADTPAALAPEDSPPQLPPRVTERPPVVAPAVAPRAAPDPAADLSLVATPGPAAPGLSPLPGPTQAEAPPAPRPPPPARQLAPVVIALAMAPGQAARLTVALEPEALGRVEVRIERDAAGEVAAVRVLAERPETLALLQRDAREFDRSLAQAGVQVPAGGMSFSLSTGAGGGQGQEQGAEAGGQRPGGRGPSGAAPSMPEAPPPRLGRSLLDIAV